MGAVGNAVIYIINEGWTPREEHSNANSSNTSPINDINDNNGINSESYLSIEIEQPDLGIDVDEFITSFDSK